MKKYYRWFITVIIIMVVVIISIVIGINHKSTRGSLPLSTISDGSGGAIIAWESGTGIYIQHINATGQALWQKGGLLVEQAKVKFDPYGPLQTYFTLVSDNAGGAIIAWDDKSSRTTDFSSTAYFAPVPIYVQRVSSAGKLLWDKSAISTGDNWEIISDGAGGVIIAWDNYKPYYKALHDDYLCLQKIAPYGKRLWGDAGLTLVTSSPFHPITQKEIPAGIQGMFDRTLPTYTGTHDIVTDGNGGVIVIWEEEGEQAARQVYAQRVDSQGNIAWTDRALVGSGIYQYNSLRADNSGGVFLALQIGNQGPIYCQQVSHNGELLALTEYFPDTLNDGSGGTIRMRIETIPLYTPPSQTHNILYVQRLDKTDIPVWPEKQVFSTREGYQIGNLKYTADGSGGIFLCWQLEKENVAYGATYTQRLDASGNILFGETGMSVFGTSDTYQGNASTLSDGSGGVFVIAAVGKGAFGGNMVYAQHIDHSGNRLWKTGIRIDQ